MENDNTESSRVRCQKRWSLMYYLRVFSQPSGQLLGHLVDITTEGAMIISDKPLAVNKDFILSMELPDAHGNITAVVMSASIIWSKPDENPHFTDTGIQLIEPSREAIEALSRLIQDLRNFDSGQHSKVRAPEADLRLRLPE